MDLSLRERMARIRDGRGDLPTRILQRTVAALEVADQRAAQIRQWTEACETATFPASAAARTDAIEAWIAHCQVRELVQPKSDATTQQILRLSWIAYCRHALMAQLMEESAESEAAIERWPSALIRSAGEFAYVSALQDGARVQVALASPTMLVGNYPAHLVLASVRLLAEILDQRGWSPSAGHYLEALFWRYAMLLHEFDVDTPASYEADDGDVVDPSAASPLIPGGCLTDFYLEAGERMFYHLLWRHRALQQYTETAAVLDIRGQANATDALCDAVIHVLRHDLLGDTVTEMAKAPLMDYFLWPGEREHVQFVYADESSTGDTDAHSVLYRLRPDAYAILQDAFNNVALPSLIRDYAKATRASTGTAAGSNTAQAPPGLDQLLEQAVGYRLRMAERVVLLATQVCLDMSIKSAGGPTGVLTAHAYLDNNALDPPYDRPPASITAAKKAATVGPGAWPLFIAIWGVYTVIDMSSTSGAVWVTPHLALAVQKWLQLALTARVLSSSHLSIFLPEGNTLLPSA